MKDLLCSRASLDWVARPEPETLLSTSGRASHVGFLVVVPQEHIYRLLGVYVVRLYSKTVAHVLPPSTLPPHYRHRLYACAQLHAQLLA